MSAAAALKKPDAAMAFPAAARLFEQITTMFASTPAKKVPRIAPKQLQASIKALKNAPDVERAAVSAFLKEVSSQLDETSPPDTEGEASAAEAQADADFESILARSLARKPGPMVTEKSEAEGAAFMEQFRKDSAAALLQRIEAKEMLTSAELQGALNIRRQSISDAVKSGRMFSVVGPSGENYYPAFYADPGLDRRAVEKVSKVMGALPGAAKYQFFTNKSFMLDATPLEALKNGRLPDVLRAAASFAAR